MSIKIGDKNKIKNSTFIENSYTNEAGKKPDSFFKSVLINVVSNIVWKILGVIVTFGLLAFLAYLANNS